MIFPIHLIENEIKNIEHLLTTKGILYNFHYIKWFDDFKEIYGDKQTNIRLYIRFALLYFIGHILILRFVLKKAIKTSNYHRLINNIKTLQEEIDQKFPSKSLFSIDYFEPFFTFFADANENSFTNLLEISSKSLFKIKVPPEFYFDFLFQRLISPSIRHKSGEFYTPPFLVKKMVNESYEFGNKVLDPCCGSGNFLIEILKIITSTQEAEKDKIFAINALYGFDINPMSIFTTKLNFLLVLGEIFKDIDLNLKVFDSLFEKEENLKDKFDLVIGNPPWYTLRDTYSLKAQNQIKDLSERLEIKPFPKNILNIEIAALFFYKAKRDYMKEGATIFFVMTKGVITGSHASRFRNFKGFNYIKIWMFSKKIEKIFNIDFICLYAQKSKMIINNYSYEIPLFYYSIKNDRGNVKYFEDFDLKLEKIDTLIPYSVTTKGNKVFTSKLILKKDFKALLPLKQSKYHSLFHKGADLNPRNLIFVKTEDLDKDNFKIIPDYRIFKKAKEPWNKEEFNNEIVEKKYIFKVVKSTELVKFYVYDYYEVFLPISNIDLDYNYANLSYNAKKFYDKINAIYLKNKKKTTKNESLMDNLNRWSKLINPRQKSETKIVFNNSGSNLNSAVIKGNIIITGDLSFYATDDLAEAYYLSAILNSPIMTEQIKIKKSSRHIFKIPFENCIKKYNPTNKNHVQLADLAIKGQEIAEITIKNLKKKEQKIPSKIIIQNMLNKKLNLVMQQIDNIVKKELRFTYN